MSFTSISDIHIKRTNSPEYQMLLNFLKFSLEKNVEYIVLLGDIFDLLVGNKEGYLEKYSEAFELLKEATDKKVHVYFFEGNHDYHVDLLLLKYFNSEYFHYRKGPEVIFTCGKRVLFDHGDNIEIDNRGYRLFQSFMRSKFMNMLADDFFKFEHIDAIGNFASSNSRKRNVKKYSSKESNRFVREKFEISAKKALDDFNVQAVVCGHSHEKEEATYENGQYFNNGYAPKEKCFCFGNSDGEISLISING